MHEILAEHYSLEDKILSRQLPMYIAAHWPRGKVTIVASAPVTLFGLCARKQWLRSIRLTEQERASTLNSIRKEQIEIDLARMRQLKFSAKALQDVLEADIAFVTDDFVHTPTDCQVLYVAYNFERKKLQMLTSWMSRKDVVVLYGQE